MPHYFYVIPARRFEGEIRPALAAAWRRRNLQPCRHLCETLLGAAEAFALRYRLGSDTLLLSAAAQGMPFSKDGWRSLVGDLLLVCAELIPEIQTTPETLRCLLTGTTEEKQRTTPIDQVHYGSRDLTFGGGFYRPENAGLNDQSDVGRLADYLAGVDSTTWSPELLSSLPEIAADDREEELEFARQCLQRLAELYHSVRQGYVIVCELI